MNNEQKRRNDRKRIKRQIMRDPHFVSSVLLRIFGLNTQLTVSAEKFSFLRTSEEHLDAAFLAHCVGNGLLRPQKNNATLYRLTRKGFKLTSPIGQSSKPDCEKNLQKDSNV